MYQKNSIYKKISLVLGITTLLLGLIPVPVLGRVGMVSADDGVVEEPVVEEPLVEEPLVEEPLVEEPLVEEPLVEEPLVEEPLTEEPLVEEPMALMSEPLLLTLLVLPVSVGPTSESPEDLGLPEDENAEGYQDDCDQPENECEKEAGDDLGDVNEVDEGETFDHEADVVVIKAGTEQFFFSPDGPECDPEEDPYCVIWNDDGTITVIRNEESSDVKDISNIQFWDGGDGNECPSALGDFGALSVNGENPCDEEEIPGCMDQTANNFDPEATEDDGSCEYDIPGCMDQAATNFDPRATEDDGSCEYDEEDPLNLTLSAVCTPGDGGYFLAWYIHNPNDFDVDASWDLNGAGDSGTMSPGSNFVGNTPLGNASYTLNASWKFGEASKSAQALCQPEIPDDPPDTTTVTFVAPQDPLIIPVTGADLDGGFPLYRRMMLLVGATLLTSGLFMKGTTKKEKKLK